MKTYQIKKSIIISLILLLFYLLIITTSTVLSEETTIYVDDVIGDDGIDNPSENYTSIQEAIDNASDGETIYVYNGTYVENISINKQVNISGESIDGVVVNGQFNVETVDDSIIS
jgi:CTP synthase (UTP-ammonia lyase)